MDGLLKSLGSGTAVLFALLFVIELVLIIMVISLSLRIRRTNAKYNSFMKGQDGASLEKDLAKKMMRIEKYAKGIGALDETIEAISAVQKKSVHKYGIVKYDAFDDVGGKLSFVLALLDDMDTGFVLNAVHSKENCFLYIKEIVKGESYIMLSNEEVEALRIAKRYGEDEVIEI